MPFGTLIRPSFTPFSVSGMHSYWTADAVTLSGSNVLTMPNQSGVGNTTRNLTVPAGTGPIYSATDSNFNNKPSVAGVTALARRLQTGTLDAALTQPSTIYTVMRVTSNANYMYWRSNAGNFTGSLGMFVDPTAAIGILSLDSANAVTSSGAVTAGNYVNCAIYNGNTSAIYMNNSQTAFASATGDGTVDAGTGTVVTIGTFTGEECNYSWTTMIVFTGAHTAAQRLQIMKWLGWKYGITVT